MSHQGPLHTRHPDYKGSSYNVMIEWENGEISSEPLHVIAKDDPVSVAVYAKENDLLDTPGWKRHKAIAKRHKKYIRFINQAKLRSYRHSKKYMFGYEVPKNYADALRLDEENGNHKWAEAIDKEITGIDDYTTFEDLGHRDTVNPPRDHQRIKLMWTFAVKHDGRFKARLCARGDMTDDPIDSVYSGVVSIRGLRLVMFLSELNGLQCWAADVTQAYLTSYTTEKGYIILSLIHI